MTLQVAVPTLISLSTLASLGPVEAVAMKDTVINALTEHPFFKDIPLDPLAAAGTNLEETVRLTGLGDHSKIPDRTTHLSNVIKELTRVAFHVQLQAMDEESQLHTSGLPLAERRTRVPKNRGAVKTLTGFSATNVDEPGAALLNADSQEAAFGYQFQFWGIHFVGADTTYCGLLVSALVHSLPSVCRLLILSPWHFGEA